MFGLCLRSQRIHAAPPTDFSHGGTIEVGRGLLTEPIDVTWVIDGGGFDANHDAFGPLFIRRMAESNRILHLRHCDPHLVIWNPYLHPFVLNDGSGVEVVTRGDVEEMCDILDR